MDIINNDSSYIANTYKRFPLVAMSGKGALIIDENGKEYIDLSSGIAVNSFGIGDTEWINAVTEQLHKIQHISNLYYTEPQVLLAKQLCERTGFKKVFFGNSGAEANEAAIKTARKYSSDKYGPGRSTIVTLVNSFHGRTIATLSATGQEKMHQHFGPFVEGFRYAAADDFRQMEEFCDDTVCAVMIEVVQGEGGVNVLDKEYVENVAKLCNDNDILLIVDEVQSGNGRCGSLYAYMQFGITPDILTTAKGIGGGLPIGATMFNDKVKDTLDYGSHGSTFGGNPICAAGACNILSRIDDKLLADVQRKSEYIRETLGTAKGVKSISGLGLMLGVEIEKDAKEVVATCLEKGVILLTAKDKIRLLPPLNIGDEQLAKAIEILKGVLAE